MKNPLAAALSLSLLLTACGDDESVADQLEAVAPTTTTVSAPTTTSSAPTTTTTSLAADEAEEAQTSEAVEPVVITPEGFSLNGFRYCEILFTVETDDGLLTDVWGTPGLDPCDDDDWYALDPDALMAEYGAVDIFMNGPRYFTVDGAVDTAGAAALTDETPPELRTFGDITMSLLATTTATNFDDEQAYGGSLVQRTETWTFEAGTEVYELVDPDGHVYVMQSYSLIEDRDLTAADLPTLGERLDLPEGWSYRARILDEPLLVELGPDGAIVVNDDFDNAYQRNG